MKETNEIQVAVNPKLEELKTRIEAAGKLDAGSIASKNVTDLFPKLLKTDAVGVSDLTFDFPTEDSLQLTAQAQLFEQSLKVNAVFTIQEDHFELTLNNYDTQLSLTLQQMAKAGLIATSIPVDSWPTVAVDGISFVFDSAVSSLTLSSASGANWDFLGYSNVFINDPKLSLVSAVKNGLLDHTAVASGTLKSSGAGAALNLPVQINLPVGLSGWSAGFSAPVTLDNGLSIIDALLNTDVTSLLPQEFVQKLKEVELTSFWLSFDAAKKTIQSIQLILNTTEDWVIVKDKLQLKKGINLTMNASRYGSEELTYNGSISGTAEVNYSDPESIVEAKAMIPIPLTGTAWTITLGNSTNDLGLGRLIAIVPLVSDILPKDLVKQLNKISIEFLRIGFKFDNGFSFTNVGFSIFSKEVWQLPMLQSAVYLDELKFSLDVDFPYKPTTTSGDLRGNIQIAGGEVTIPVSIAKEKEEEEWLLNVTSDSIPLPSISDLSDFMGMDVLTSGSPSGLMGIGNFAINDLNLQWALGANSKLQLLSFSIESTPETPAWNLVPDYFVLSDLFIALKIENTSVSDKDISGSIGTTVTLLLEKGQDRKDDKYLKLGMVATKPASDKPWNFSGSLKEEVDLDLLLLALKLPQSVVDILPKPTLKISQFDLAMEPTSKSFSTSMTIKASDKWTILSVGAADITLDTLFFSIEHYADNTDLEAKGTFNIGTDTKKCEVTVAASYKKKIWNFTGTFNNSQGLTINEVLKKYIDGIDAATIPQISISKILVDLKKGPKSTGSGDYSKLNFSINGELKIPVIESLSIQAAVNVLYNSEETSPYDGTKVAGTLYFGGLSFGVSAEYLNNKFSKYTFKLVYKNITAICEADTSDPDEVKFDFQLKSTDPSQTLSLGDVIATFIEAATGEAPTIPSPWDFINKIPLSGFGFLFTYNKKTKAKTVGITHTLDLNLGFISIKKLGITYSPEANKDQGPVQFKVIEGTFLGIPIDQLAEEEKPGWDMRKPEDAPKVPGMGDGAFKLENLSLGNQVAIVGGEPPKSVVKAIEDLERAFEPEGDDTKLPTRLTYDKNYGWLIGAQFTLIKYINVAVVFYDPVIYGLSIDVKGGKFEGLYFQVLYKKITDNVGVFQIDLTLPDFVRKQNFGAVSITLPSISLSIFTNGDFIIDMGFPHNGDFGRSFGLEYAIFTGAGGFYFGKLSNDTATDFNLPKANGQFNPVIAFGIGIRAGLGRSVDKGVLKAELSLTLQVILEGIIAYYEANPSSSLQSGSDQYFRLQAQAGLTGRIYGEIDFVIISASLDITAKILAELVLEAYRKAEITFTAAVSASVKVRINLGLFKITISCSFSTSISDSFTIGSDSQAPWDTAGVINRRAFFTAIDAPNSPVIPEMDWTAQMDYPKAALNVLFLPQMSVKYKAGDAPNKQGVGVSLLYVTNEPNSGATTDFTVLSRAVLAWTFNAYFAKNGVKAEKILDQVVTIEDLNAIYAYLNQDRFSTGTEGPFGTDELLKYLFAQAFSTVSIQTKKETSREALNESEQSVAIFPMFPVFEMTVADQPPIDFMKFGACDEAYLKAIKDYFREMKIQFNNEQSPTEKTVLKEGVPATLAEYLFIDYFVMIAKSGIQDAINDYKQIELRIGEGQSIQDLIDSHEGYGIVAGELVFSNRHQPLKMGAKVSIPEFKYRVRKGEKVKNLTKRFPELSLNHQQDTDGYVTIPTFEFEIKETHDQLSLWTISERYGIDFNDLIVENMGRRDLFADGTKLVHAFVEEKTVGDILDYLQTGEKYSLSNLGGTASRFFLHGLRIPANSEETARIALYEATGQQFSLTNLLAEDLVSLKMNEGSTAPAWLKFADTNQVNFELTEDFMAAARMLETSAYMPTLSLDNQENVKRYKLQAKTFTLPVGLQWQNPNIDQAGDEMVDSFIWKFPGKLQQFLNDHPSVAFDLLLQTRNTSFSLNDSVPVTPLYWSTAVEVKVKQVLSPSNGKEPLQMVYEVEGCGEADGALLQQLIQTETALIRQVDVLFADNQSKNNNGTEVKGLVSNALNEFKTFLLQTNYSTVSNPIGADSNGTELLVADSNLVGMDAKTFLTYLWECSIVRSGGYYLSYNNGSGGGLPDYLFDEEGTATITVLISYNLTQQTGTTAWKLPAYVNSVVINKKLVPAQDNLYLEVYLTEAEREVFNPDLQTIQATILPGTGLFRGSRTNPGLLQSFILEDSAENQLSELFNLLEYRIEQTPENYIETKFALPAGPTVEDDSPVNSISAPLRQATEEDGWIYSSVLPVYPFVIPSGVKQHEATDLQTDPYGANGKPATVYFNFLDVFGNTLSPDKGVGSGITQIITPAYTDPVIGLDQWVNVAKNYTISMVSGKPTLKVNLSFDTVRYEDPDSRKAMATRDYEFYQKVNWQLIQTDVQVNVVSTIGELVMPERLPVDLLKEYVSTIMSYLDGIIHPTGKETAKPPVIATTLALVIDADKLNEDFIFALNVDVEIERTGTIDPQFIKEPTIRFSSSTIPADLYEESETETSPLDKFATNLETALPVMKVALGQSQPSAKQKSTFAEQQNLGSDQPTNEKEVWLIRYAGTTGDSGIALEVSQVPTYFSTRPLSTKLISRPSEDKPTPVPLRTYHAGTYVGDETPENKSFAGIDMEVLARTFVAAMDQFLSAQISTHAWNLQYSKKPGNSLDPKTNPFQVIEQAKKDVADAIANDQLTAILQGADISGITQAREALRQQLLIGLGKAYSINAVVQNNVTVTQGFQQPTANFYGELIPVEKTQNNAYSFSPVKISLLQGSQTGTAPKLTTMFSVRPETSDLGEDQTVDLIGAFKMDLDYQISGVEHNFGVPVNGYVPSSWLTLAHPIVLKSSESEALIKANIPIPLKAYPTAPSMVAQEGVATYSDNDAGKTSKEILERALKWSYVFRYDYISAQQDLIYLNIRFNVKSNTLTENEVVELDLFEALMQFSHSYETILADFEKNDENALIALQSFAWLTQQVGNAWKTWFKNLVGNTNGLAETEQKFTIREFRGTDQEADGVKLTDYLMLTVSSLNNDAGTSMPLVEISGFVTKTYTPQTVANEADTGVIYYFVQVIDGTETPLLYGDRKKISERIIRLTDHNILREENAWAGISIHRNEILTGKPANRDFLYVTPYIRFAEPSLPSLYSNGRINIADFTQASADKTKLNVFLLNFFREMLKGVSVQKLVIQLRCGYTYALQPDDGAGVIPLGPVLPILLTVPINTEWEALPDVLLKIEETVSQWIETSGAIGIDGTGKLNFELSLYSSLSASIYNPVLKLAGLYLDTKVVDFS